MRRRSTPHLNDINIPLNIKARKFLLFSFYKFSLADMSSKRFGLHAKLRGLVNQPIRKYNFLQMFLVLSRQSFSILRCILLYVDGAHI